DGIRYKLVTGVQTCALPIYDYQVRKNQIIRFLGDGHKVRAMIFHRGREMAHQEVGRAKMDRLLVEIGDQGQIETMPRMEGNVLEIGRASCRERQQEWVCSAM